MDHCTSDEFIFSLCKFPDMTLYRLLYDVVDDGTLRTCEVLRAEMLGTLYEPGMKTPLFHGHGSGQGHGLAKGDPLKHKAKRPAHSDQSRAASSHGRGRAVGTVSRGRGHGRGRGLQPHGVAAAAAEGPADVIDHDPPLHPLEPGPEDDDALEGLNATDLFDLADVEELPVHDEAEALYLFGPASDDEEVDIVTPFGSGGCGPDRIAEVVIYDLCDVFVDRATDADLPPEEGPDSGGARGSGDLAPPPAPPPVEGPPWAALSPPDAMGYIFDRGKRVGRYQVVEDDRVWINCYRGHGCCRLNVGKARGPSLQDACQWFFCCCQFTRWCAVGAEKGVWRTPHEDWT